MWFSGTKQIEALIVPFLFRNINKSFKEIYS